MTNTLNRKPMIQYIIGFLIFFFGSLFYLLSKIKDYKALAEANTNSDVNFSFKTFIKKESLNLIQLYLGGLAIVIFLPYIIGGATVELKSANGGVISNFEVKEVLMPMYFMIGWAGNSAIINIFGKYKKTLLDPIGGND